MTVCEAVSSRIKTLLAKFNMTQYRLEQNSGIQHGVMNRIIKCCNKGVELGTVVLLANGFGMTLLEFLDDPVFSMDIIEAE